ncbi:probable inactive peptidyl-prolyl cis-trans isomerase-like 6 [Liolophura sinensis]|uniref:probable inactive peptidyl-prolyl cis-trans isomerase-like 6 n=1 Tax=Liolophura sinensis TaxID=3198878 RepID=UPI00315887A0
MADETTYRVEIVGLLNDVSFTMARYCLEDLQKNSPKVFVDAKVTGLLDVEWNTYKEEKIKELRGETWEFEDKAFVFVNGQMIGGPEVFISWAEHNHGHEEFRPESLFLALTEETYAEHMNNTKHDFVFMDFTIGDEPSGRLVIELFSDLVPKTCKNFLELCTGRRGLTQDQAHNLHYKDSVIHRIVPNGWIQGGDIYYGRGNGGESIYGLVFEDENYCVKHTKRGIVGMCNKGRHTNGSQFYITLQPAKWMDTRFVAFGQIVEGAETLKKIEEQETLIERPVKEVKIVNCGQIKYNF